MLKRRAVGILVVIAAVASLLLSNASPASAHATLVRTDPADGTNLEKAPRQVRLWFSEAITPDFTRIDFRDGDGKYITLSPYRLDTESMAAAQAYGEKTVVLVVDLPELTSNAYRLYWQTRSADDLHVILGSVTFGVQRSVSATAPTENAPVTQPGEVGMRWLNFVGLAGLLGGLTLAFVVIPAGKEDETAVVSRRRLTRLALYAGLVAFAAGFGLLFVQGAEGAAWWTILTRTDYGLRWWIAQGCLLLLLLTLFVLRNRFSLNRFLAAGLALLIAAVATTQGFNGHSGGLNGPSPLSVAVDGLHVLGATLWVGGLLGLIVAIVPLLRRGPDETALAWTTLGRFGWLAATSLVVLIVTGLLKSSQQVASLDGLLTTIYGQALLLKVELALLVGLVGLLNAALLHPRVAEGLRRVLRRPVGWKPGWSRFLKRALILEAIGGVGLLLVAAFLSATQPARGPEFDPPPAIAENATSPSVSGSAADLVVSLSVKPNRPGQNFVSFNVYNTRRPIPAPIEDVSVRLRSISEPGTNLVLPAELLGKDRYQIAGGFIKTAGDWEISITVNRPGMPAADISFPWKVLSNQGYTARRPVVFSNEPLTPWLIGGALGLAFLLGGGLLALGRGRKFRLLMLRRSSTIGVYRQPPQQD